ncbi:ABC transporter permease [Natrinema salifodinae]|uniref:Spermidine/putrescine transport system permease protein n=1 Tax=Natrinema salifodinae TaxID=1202768 RepID=A0A1I0M8M6_9EURY|nr:ABC transporter permease [Natrinema salifodinae]SEV84703.1 spermidine/putrescine transport system permease protein [Natrinema salifodinae]
MAGTQSQSTLPAPVARLWTALEERSRSKRALLLMAPLMAFELLIFLAPFLILLRISLSEGASNLAYVEGTWSLSAYADVFTSDLYWSIIWYSFKLGIIVTAITVAVALFYAYAIWRSEGLIKSALLFSVVLPLLTTLVIKTYAFMPLLSPSGTLNDVLLSLNLISEPIQFVPGTVGVVVGQVYIVLPYAVLAIYSVLATMDWGIVEAARDLGASRPRSVLEVVVPQAIPGITVATVISFAWSVGAYAAPGLLGGGDRTFAMQVEQQLLSDLQWEVATAFSVVMLVLMFASVAALFAVLSRFGGEFEYA